MIKTDRIIIENDALKSGVIHIDEVGFGINPHYNFPDCLIALISFSYRSDQNHTLLTSTKYHGDVEDGDRHSALWKNDSVLIQTRSLNSDKEGLQFSGNFYHYRIKSYFFK